MIIYVSRLTRANWWRASMRCCVVRARSLWAHPTAASSCARFGDCQLNFATREFTKAGVPQLLTTAEFGLRKALVTHPRLPLSRDKLMELARGRDHAPFDRAIDVQISRLRKLVEANAAQPRFIQTVWGHGYVFVPDAASAP